MIQTDRVETPRRGVSNHAAQSYNVSNPEPHTLISGVR
jgi:hypothetical protein